MDRSNLITVVIVNYNHGKYLPRSIDAICKQKQLPYKLIISDDQSTDNSIEIVDNYVEKYDWIVLKKNENNLGVNANVNSTIDFVETKYCIFAAADDFLDSDYIFRANKLIQNNGEVGLLCSPTYQFSESKGIEGFYGSTFISNKVKKLNTSKFKKTFLMHGVFFKGATSIYNIEIFKKYGGYSEKIGSYADTVIAYICGSYGGCIYDPKPGAFCERFSSGFASTTMRSQKKLLEIVEAINLNRSFLDDNAYKKIIIPIIERYLFIVIKNLHLSKNVLINENDYSYKFLIYFFRLYFLFSPSWRLNIFYKIIGFLKAKYFKYTYIKKNKKTLKF